MVRERIARDWLRGVSELHLSKMYRVQREVVEQTVRFQVGTMLVGLRKGVVATACLLVGIVGMDAWDATVGEGAAIQRSFRCRARGSRRRGLEDELAEAVEHARADLATEAPGLAMERAV